MNEKTIMIKACRAYIKELYKLLEFHNSINPLSSSKERPSISTTILRELHLIEDLEDEISKNGNSISFRETGKKIPKGINLLSPETKQKLIEACSAYEALLNNQIDFQSKLSSTVIKKELLIEVRMLGDIADRLVNTSEIGITPLSVRREMSKRVRKQGSIPLQSTLKGISKRGRKPGSKNKK